MQYRNRAQGPLLALIGAEDDYTGVQILRGLSERRAAGGSADPKIYRYARHASTGHERAQPLVRQRAELSRRGDLLEDDGRAVEARSGETVDFTIRAGPPSSSGRTCLKEARHRRERSRQAQAHRK